MKRSILFLFFLTSAIISHAQITIDLGQIQSAQNVDLKCLIQDAKTGDALPYTTVYLIPQDDTTITHFALSDEKGAVKIEDIVPGKYVFNAELIGYKPYKKVYDFYGFQKNLGAIRLEENPEYIDAATITALGNPVTIKKDTIEYNATAFHVGENAMLEDLLKKMPGMEVASDGTVTVNGEKVDKITVGGKTFFFNDPAMAVKNLPAKIVEKIKVIDKKKEEAEFTGIATKDDKEKVMDVQLKEEYKKGWFGNATLSGGSTIVPDEDKKLSGQPGALFNGNVLAAGYNETDQLTILGNGKNVVNPDEGYIVISDFNTEGTDELASKQGLETTAQAGANYNTSRVKGFDSNVSVNYNFNRKDVRETSKRTTFQQSSSDIVTDGDYIGKGDNHRINTAIELNKADDSKYLLMIRPSFSYTSQDREISNSSSTASGIEQKNNSTSFNGSHNNLFITRTDFKFGVKDLGKERRSLTFSGSYNYRGMAGNSSELSVTEYSSYTDRRHLNYDNKDNRHAAEGVLTYVEPLGEKWSLQGRVTGCYIGSRVTKDAFNGDDGSVNDYYSAISNNDDWLVRERLLAQWKNDNTTALFGVQLDQEQNVTFSRALGNESTVGKNQWIFNWAPYAEIEWSKDNNTLSFDYGGRSNTPYGSQIIPTLNINNPVQVTAGNIYLRPSFSHNSYISFRHNNPTKYSFLNLSLDGNVSTNEIVYASWFDADGNRYAIPVNSQKPSLSTHLYCSFEMPLDQKKHFTFSLYTNVQYSLSTSYQARTMLPGLDKDNFNYTNMMSWFWGNEDGNLFYSGTSGFAQSKTNILSYRILPSLEYKLDNFSTQLSAGAWNRITKYSLNPTANMNSWDFEVDANILYSAPKGWEFGTFASYNFYRGYSAGYGDPEFIWNVGISKQIKAVTLSLRVNDILNQRKSLNRTATEAYVQDVYHNVIGRYILFGVTFNFGKMNAKNNARAQEAMWNMIF